jgi:glycosidase
MPTERQDIPLLTPLRVQPGRPVITARSYTLGRENLQRHPAGRRLPVAIEFDATVAGSNVRIYREFITSNDTSGDEVELDGAFPKFHHSGLTFDRCGLWRFKIIYDNDSAATWDAAAFSYVLIEPAWIDDMRLYTLIPTACGHFGEWQQDLDRIVAMGFNAVHILPVTAMDTSASPYAAADLFAIDDGYVDPGDGRDAVAQWETLVAEIKQRGLRLCVDLAFNAVGFNSVIARQRPHWLCEDSTEADGIRRAGWYGNGLRHKWSDLALLDYDQTRPEDREQLWSYMTEYANYWARYAAETNGMVRLDNLHSSHPGFTRHLVYELRKRYPDLVLFGEVFTDEETVDDAIGDYGLNLLLGTPWEHKFVPKLRSYFDYIHSRTGARYFTPPVSHDTGTPTQEFGCAESAIPRLFASVFFGSGPSGIVQGFEWGCRKPIPFIGRRPRDTAAIAYDLRPQITDYNRIVASANCFQQQGNLKFVDDNHDAVIAAVRQDTGGAAHFLLAANFDTESSQTVVIDTAAYNLEGVDATDVQTSELITLPPVLTLELPPCGVRILRV